MVLCTVYYCNRPLVHFRFDSKIIRFSRFCRCYVPLMRAKMSIYFSQTLYRNSMLKKKKKKIICYEIVLWFLTRLKYIQILRKLYSKLCFLSAALAWNGDHFALRKGINSFRKQQKRYNFRIKSELCKWYINNIFGVHVTYLFLIFWLLKNICYPFCCCEF